MRWLKILASIGALILAWRWFYGSDGVHIAYATSNCGEIKISVDAEFYRRWLDMRGDKTGYGLLITAPGRKLERLYFVNCCGRYDHGPTAIDFSPLPPESIGMPMRVFELPDKTYGRDTWPTETPPFLNVFLDPMRFAPKEFEWIADCLQKNRRSVNAALAGLASEFPWNDRSSYYPLRLGGVVYGLPPHTDQRYRAAINAVWGVPRQPPAIVPVPTPGRITVLPGQRAEATFDGFKVVISVPNDGEPDMSIDPRLPLNPPFIVTYVGRHLDESATFSVSVRGADGLYREHP
jgi:hypothetical protein